MPSLASNASCRHCGILHPSTFLPTECSQGPWLNGSEAQPKRFLPTEEWCVSSWCLSSGTGSVALDSLRCPLLSLQEAVGSIPARHQQRSYSGCSRQPHNHEGHESEASPACNQQYDVYLFMSNSCPQEAVASAAIALTTVSSGLSAQFAVGSVLSPFTRCAHSFFGLELEVPES